MPDYVAAWKPGPELFERIAPPRAIFNLGAGVDALLQLPNVPADVPVVRLEDAGMAAQMAQYVSLAVLAAHRRRDDYARQQRAREWRALPSVPARNFRVGLLGLGVLGGTCAAALRPFGYTLLGWSRTAREVPGVETFAGDEGLGALLRQVQMLVCLLPSTPATRGILDRARLAQLPHGAHVVNVARGDLLVDADLLTLLDEGHLAGATLDVFHEEPLPAAHPFWHHPGIVLTPHVSAVTLVRESAEQVAAKIRQLERGEPVTGIIDRQRGY
jgi:glyoxylate/hydroxypyruvate reductase A